MSNADSLYVVGYPLQALQAQGASFHIVLIQLHRDGAVIDDFTSVVNRHAAWVASFLS